MLSSFYSDVICTPLLLLNIDCSCIVYVELRQSISASIDFCSVVPEVVKVQVSNLCVNDKFLLSVMIMKDLRPTLVNMSVGLFH